MAVLNKIPDGPVHMIDIRDTINAYGGSADNNLLSFFQENDNNMWAKFKPIILKNLNFFNLWDTTSAGRYGYMGEDGSCGLTIPEFTSPKAIRDALESGADKWTYNPPKGGTVEPLRLGDFRRYIYRAVCPIGSMASSYILHETTTGYEFDINVEVVVQESDLNLTLSDLGKNGVKFTDMYLGVYLKPQSGSGYYFGGTSEKIGSNGELAMTLKGDSGTPGKYDAYVFLSTKSQADEEQDGLFYGLNKTAQAIEIKSSDTLHLFTAACIWHADGTAFDYEIIIQNNTSSQTTYSGIKVYLGERDSSGAVNNILDWDASETSKVVQAGGTAYIRGTITTRRQNGVTYVAAAGCSTPQITPIFGDMDSLPEEE